MTHSSAILSFSITRSFGSLPPPPCRQGGAPRWWGPPSRGCWPARSALPQSPSAPSTSWWSGWRHSAFQFPNPNHSCARCRGVRGDQRDASPIRRPCEGSGSARLCVRAPTSTTALRLPPRGHAEEAVPTSALPHALADVVGGTRRALSSHAVPMHLHVRR